MARPAISGETAHWIARHVTLALLLGFALVPILWLVLTSFKTRMQVFASPPLILFTPSFEAWLALLRPGPVRQALLNSAATAGLTTIVTLACGVLAAYAFSRLSFRGRHVMFVGVLATRLLPPMNGVVVLYLLFTRFRLTDSIVALVILYTALLVPIAIWLLRTAIDAVPRELEEAALIDGTRRLGTLFRITLPLAAPGLAVTGILVFVLSWNEFMFAYIFTSTRAVTVPVLLAKAVGEYGVDWADLTAQATVLLIPAFVVSVLAQRHLVSGLTGGGVK